MIDSETFCAAPFSDVAIIPNGSISPCCFFKGHLKDKNGPILYDIDKAWNSDHLKRVRSDLLSGIKAPECNKCWRDEDLGLVSLRNKTNNLSRNVILEDPRIISMNVSISNKCNLKCLMCASDRSNQIAIEDNISEFMDLNFPLYDYMTRNSEHLRVLIFTGGEPFVQKEVFDIIDYLIENDYSKDIFLMFNTNGTVVKKNFFKKMKFFKHVKIRISLEGYGKRQDYIRFPSRWESIEENVKYIVHNLPRENSSLHFNTVFQNISVCGLKELSQWFNSLHMHDNINGNHTHSRLSYPSFLRSYILPESAKDRVKDFLNDHSDTNLRGLCREMLQPYTEEEKNNFINYIKKKDKLRGINILDYCPEFEEWFI